MKKNNKIEKSERIEILRLAIWFNLFIGIYNLYVFNEMNSLFHLVIGSANVGVWVFFRKPETLISLSGNESKKKKNN